MCKMSLPMRRTMLAALCAITLVATATEDIRWGYQDQDGPERWAAQHPAFATCASGMEQSPIDLTDAQRHGTLAHRPHRRPAADLQEITFDYAPGPISILNNGHTIQVDHAPGNGITLDGTRYELVQFHFHHGSEHTVNGVRFPLEMHLVHRGDNGALAVVGVLFEEGSVNNALESIWNHLPRESGAATPVPVELDARALLPERLTSWRYAGSLTTPPCTEGVSWVVMTEPVTLSATQIEAFGAIFFGNYRPVQPLNGRVVERRGEMR